MTEMEKTLAELFGSEFSKQDLITAIGDLDTFDRSGELPQGRVRHLRDQLAQADGLAHAPVLSNEQYCGFVRVHVFKLAARLWYEAQNQQPTRSAKLLSPGEQLAALLVLRRGWYVQDGLARLAQTNFCGLGEAWAKASELAKDPRETLTQDEFKLQQDVCTALAPYFHDTIISILRAVTLPFSRASLNPKGGSPGLDAAITWLTTVTTGRMDLL